MRHLLIRPTIFTATILVIAFARPAIARVKLEHLCTIQGQQEVRLTGIGLVTGLPGTGDGTKSLPTIRALRSALTRMNQPVLEVDLKNADSVAMVMIEATIPRTGLRRGQKIDCTVSTMLGAKSLRGGRLLSAPLTSVEVRNDVVVGLAGGSIVVEEIVRPTSGRIVQGVDLKQDVNSLFMSQQQGPTITLLIDPHHASFYTASEIARAVNSEFSFEVGGRQIARPVSPAAVELQLPEPYRDTPVDFIAQVLDIGINTPTTQARVVLNSKTGTVVVTGEVEISPVIVTHKSFSVEVGSQDAAQGPGPFLVLPKDQTGQSSQQLKQLVDALNQLRVPAEDIVGIIRELNATGKLHAELIER